MPFFARHVLLAMGGLLVVVACTRCVDILNIDTDTPDRQLVVDGFLRSGTGEQNVSLVYASAFEQSVDAIEYPVREATVTLFRNAEPVAVYTRVRPGHWQIPPETIDVRPGHAYALDVRLDDGRHYRSVPAVMPQPVAIDTLTVTGVTTPDYGYEVQVSTTDPEGPPSYYLWLTEGVYIWENFTGRIINVDFDDRDVDLEQDRFRDGTRLASVPIRRYTDNPKKLLFAYTLRVEQLTLPARAYAFWSQVRTQLENSDGTLAAPPAPLRGNIANVADSTDRALGYYTVAGRTKSEVCVAWRPFYPEIPRPFVTDEDLFSNAPIGSPVKERLRSLPEDWACAYR